MAVLEVQNIRKSFGELEVLQGIDFSLEKGETLAIIGSSGSGKTTLLRCLNFLETLDAGRIIVNGEQLLDAGDARKLSDAEIRRDRLHFGLVFQSFNLFPQYTALQNVMLAPTLQLKEQKDAPTDRKAALAQIETRAKALLEQVGLDEKLHYYPHQLSGGQQQRVAIARALATNPTLLLADEPTGALDQATGEQVMELFTGLNAEGRTIIMITHDLKIARHASRIVNILDGELSEGVSAYD